MFVDEPGDVHGLGDLGPHWSEGHARTQVKDLRGALSVVTADGDRVYPLAQFRRTPSGVEVRVGVGAFVEAMADVEGWTVLVFLHAPLTELGGRSPLDFERQHPEAVDRLREAGCRVRAQYG